MGRMKQGMLFRQRDYQFPENGIPPNADAVIAGYHDDWIER